MKSCGACANWFKFRNHNIGGLCEANDCTTYSDYGRNCKDFKPLKYKREKFNWKGLEDNG